jgi:undecaprenyl diphosphate synthase
LSYGGRAEIVDAVKSCFRAVADGKLSPEDIDEAEFARHLYAPDVPDPDLIIRTSGEKRTSNFLLWESAYSEYHFTDVLWPDFSESDLELALADYAGRDRRRGGHR